MKTSRRNILLLLGIVLLIALPLILGACSPSNAATPENNVITDDKGTPDIQVPPLDDGTDSVSVDLSYDLLAGEKYIVKDVDVQMPGSLIVSLGSNPSTGYTWKEAEIENIQVLSEYSRQFVEPQTDLVGAAGKDVWTFKTLAKGETTVKFQYTRPWQNEDTSNWTVVLTINVK